MSQISVADIVSMISNAVVAIAAIVALRIGVKQVNQWRAELEGRATFELARNIISLTFRFQDEYHYTRSLFTMEGESRERPKQEDETPQVRRSLDEQFARVKRLEALRRTT
jgi:hypothetical protein